MPFIQTLKGYLAQGGTKALNRTLKFDETDILHRALPYFTRTLGYDSLKLETAEEGLAKAKELESSASPDPSYNVPIIELAEPGSPGVSVFAYQTFSGRLTDCVVVACRIQHLRSRERVVARNCRNVSIAMHLIAWLVPPRI